MKVIVLLLSGICGMGFSQVIDTSYLTKYESDNNFYFLKKSIYETEGQKFKSGVFKMDNNLELLLISAKKDFVNRTHMKYIQTLNGIKILGTDFTIHFNDAGLADVANGKLVRQLNVNTSAEISEDVAIKLAIKADGSNLFEWQDSLFESKNAVNGDESELYPKAEKIIMAVSGNEANYKLAYKIRIEALDPPATYDYFVDGRSGEIIKKLQVSRTGCGQNTQKNVNKCLNSSSNKSSGAIGYSQLPICNNAGCQTGSANTKFYGLQNIMTDYFTYGVVCRYRLKNSCSSRFIYVREGGSFNDFRNIGNSWGNNDQVATSALWSAERTDEFYNSILGRNSFNDASGQLNINVFPQGDPTYKDNAVWAGNTIWIGDNVNNVYEYVGVDIIGHEYTHGVDDYEFQLNYEKESGALDESFADIFGTMVEFFTAQNYNIGLSANYLIGENSKPGGSRDMSNPKSLGQPDTYLSTTNNWFNITGCVPTPGPPSVGGNDMCGVHTNSGVQNHWFFLLAEGGSGTNDNNDTYCIQGIGRTKATQIAYDNFRFYLGSSNATFPDARAGSIQAAINLFGVNSNEVAQVTQAWYAVGVGAAYNGVIDVKNHVASATENYAHNSIVAVQNFTALNISDVTITSSKEVRLLPNVDVNQGAVFTAFITPACNGGAKLINPSSINNQNTTNNTTVGELATKESISEFDIIPNPSEGIFKFVSAKGAKPPTNIVVTNLLGNVVKEVKLNDAGEAEINISEFSNGLYLIQVLIDGKTLTKRIIKN